LRASPSLAGGFGIPAPVRDWFRVSRWIRGAVLLHRLGVAHFPPLAHHREYGSDVLERVVLSLRRPKGEHPFVATPSM
jgi:hypothetical protein